MSESRTSRRGGAATLTPPISKRAAAINEKLNSVSAGSSVDMKGAVKAAIECIEGFFPEAKDILLEEVALEQGPYVANAVGVPTSQDKFWWRVVISFKSGTSGTLAEVMGGGSRLYREIQVDRESGDIRSIGTWGK